MSFLKSGGWMDGKAVRIRKDLTVAGERIQVCSFVRYQDGMRHSREYFELRSMDKVVSLGSAVKTLKAAIAEAQSK